MDSSILYDDGYFAGMHTWWWVFWLLVIVAVLAYNWFRPAQIPHRPRLTPHELLRRRLASGEIASQQYEEHKALLDRDAGRKA